MAMPKCNHRQKDRGVGITEVIVSVVLVLILATVFIRLFKIAYGKYRLNMAITSVAHELEMAREQAKERKQDVSVIFIAKEGHFGIDRNRNGMLDYNEFEELPEGAKLSEDASVVFTKSGKPARGSKEPRIIISNTRGSRNVSVSSLGIIEIE